MNHLISLEAIRHELYLERNNIRNELRNYPKASMILIQDHGKVQKYMINGDVPPKKRIGIGRDPEMVHKLARKAYIDAKIGIIEQNIALLEGAMAGFKQYGPADVIAALPKHFGKLPEDFLLTPAVKQRVRVSGPFPDENVPARQAVLWLDGMSAEEWGVLPYRPNTKFADSRTILMHNGLKVRSKSESAIISLFRDLGLIYHYDETLDFEELMWSMSGTFASELGTSSLKSPDFILARNDGKLIYHEHVGLTQDSGYMADLQLKLQLYFACGIVLWDNLILTFDEPGGGINMQLVEAQLSAKGLI